MTNLKLVRDCEHEWGRTLICDKCGLNKAFLEWNDKVVELLDSTNRLMLDNQLLQQFKIVIYGIAEELRDASAGIDNLTERDTPETYDALDYRMRSALAKLFVYVLDEAPAKTTPKGQALSDWATVAGPMAWADENPYLQSEMQAAMQKAQLEGYIERTRYESVMKSKVAGYVDALSSLSVGFNASEDAGIPKNPAPPPPLASETPPATNEEEAVLPGSKPARALPGPAWMNPIERALRRGRKS